MVCNFEDERWTEGVVLSRITMWAPNLEPKHNSVWSELTKSSCLKLPNLETKPDFSLTAPFPLVSPPPWADCRPKISWSSIWLELRSDYCHFERNKEAHRLLLQKKSGAAVAVKGKICPPLRQHWLISYLLSDFTSVHVCMWQWLLLPSCPYLGVEREGGGGTKRGRFYFRTPEEDQSETASHEVTVVVGHKTLWSLLVFVKLSGALLLRLLAKWHGLLKAIMFFQKYWSLTIITLKFDCEISLGCEGISLSLIPY